MQWLEKLKGFREIGAFVMMGLLALQIVIGLIRVATAGEYDPGLSWRAAVYHSTFTYELVAVVLVLLVLSLATQAPKSPRVGLVALIGAIVIAVGLLAYVVFGLIGLGNDFDGGGEMFRYLLSFLLGLILPAVCAAVLLMVFLGNKPAPAPYQHPQQYGSSAPGQMGPGYGPGMSGQGASGQPGAPGQPMATPPAAQQPTWAPDQASGGAWQTAGQAASGASATEWGQPGQQQGWAPGSAMSAAEHTGPVGIQPGQPGQSDQYGQPAQSDQYGQPAQSDPYQQPGRYAQPGHPQQSQDHQQGWGPASATEHTGPIPTDPNQGNQWQPVDPNNPPGGYR